MIYPICIIDTETTGMGPDDQVVELGAAFGRLMDFGVFSLEQAVEELINPGRKIPPQSSAVHHITDKMVKGKPTLDDVMEDLPVAEVYVAHNAKFDRGFLPHLKAAPWICTLKCAYHLWHDAPSYGLQTLRYWLGYEIPDTAGRHAHRALYDVVTTMVLLEQLSKHLTIEQMIEISSRPRLLRVINFGKHAGTKFKDLPPDYLDWMRRQKDFDEDVVYTLQQLGA